MEQVTVSTRTNGQDAFLSFEAPASAFESLLTSLAGDGVIVYREVRSDGRLPSAGSDDWEPPPSVLPGRTTICRRVLT